MKAKGGYVYIVSNKKRNVVYIGITSDLYSRITQHKEGNGSEFTSKYKCTDLVYHEFFDGIVEAIEREKVLKKWKRQYKDDLIATINPDLKDLYEDIFDHR